MISGVCLGTNNLDKAGEFYDAVLATIDMVRIVTVEGEIGYGNEGGAAIFWVLTPFNGARATYGNGTQVMFSASSEESVQAFYNTALDLGGRDEGAPGPRDYSPGYYGAYVRDLDGNKLHVHVVR